jgi:hypothetical protein
LREWEAHEAEH